MSDNVDEEFARRLSEVAASVAGLSEDQALEALETRLKQIEVNGLALHRLSLAQARGTLALALAEGAEPDVITSLEELIVTIEQSGPSTVHQIGSLAQVADPDAPEYDPELAGNLENLLARHRENAVTILRLIAKATVDGTDPDLLAALDALLNHDLAAISELEPHE
jgi:hypothetical protein